MLIIIYFAKLNIEPKRMKIVSRHPIQFMKLAATLLWEKKAILAIV